MTHQRHLAAESESGASAVSGPNNLTGKANSAARTNSSDSKTTPDWTKEMSDPTDDELDNTKDNQSSRMADSSWVKKASMITMASSAAQLPDGLNEQFFTELRRSCVPQSLPELVAPSPAWFQSEDEVADEYCDAATDQFRFERSCHQFRRVRPLHMCAVHSFLYFRDNGDLVAVRPHCVLIYDRPPAACEITYKEPLFCIPVCGVSRAADINETSIALLRQGSFQTSEERAPDELLIAEVATNVVRLLASICLQQTTVGHSMLNQCFVLKEMYSRHDSPECRGMQVNQREHKVYLLYDYHLMAIDLDMRLEPVVVKLSCRRKETGPAVALLEFEHAVYVLTATSCLLATNKAQLFTTGPSSCCLPILLRLDGTLAQHEMRSYVVDRKHFTAFFSVPNGRKLLSLRFPVPIGNEQDSDAAFEPLIDCVSLQERLYSAASCTDWAAVVPCALAWDATTEQLLVLEWGPDSNGILISLDIHMEEGRSADRGRSNSGPEVPPIRDQFCVVKTFCRPQPG